jgi:hypothetical protein
VRDAVAALRRERDELAVQLAQIEAYQPGIAAKARAWVEQVDRPARPVMPLRVTEPNTALIKTELVASDCQVLECRLSSAQCRKKVLGHVRRF